MIRHFNPINLMEVSLEKQNIGDSHSKQKAASARLCDVSKKINLCAAIRLKVNNEICYTNKIVKTDKYLHLLFFPRLAETSSEIVSNY